MVFSSITFLCLFLPVTLLIYNSLPSKFRNLFLFAASLVFYAWGEPRYILIMLFSTVFDFCNGLLLEKLDQKGKAGGKKAVLILSVVVNIGLLCFFKYTDFAIQTIDQLFGANLLLLRIALPIGISFYTFQTLSYTIDVYRGLVKAQHNINDFGMYISMFPQLIAGPIVRYAEIESQLQNRKADADQIINGMLRFTCGLCKKVLIANQVGALWDEIYATGGTIPALTAWIGALAFAFQIYFDFSGYSDMAIGLGLMLGFRFPENFKHPYESASITEFWRRWHITLGVWFREYVYIPLGGNRKGIVRQICNLFIVWFLTGLWHGAGWNFILWGLYFFVFLSLEKLFLLKCLKKLPRFVSHCYALLVILFSWVIFACDEPDTLGRFAASFFGANGFLESMSLYYLKTYGLLLLLAALLSTSLISKLLESFKNRDSIGQNVRMAICLPALALCVVFIAGDTYNPFLYFRF